MNKRRFLIIAIGLCLLSQFNNCGSGSDNQDLSDSILSPCDPQDPNLINDPNAPAPNTNCALPDQSNLQIQPDIDNMTIGESVGDFTIGGTCNAGAYPANIITWQLNLTGQMVRNSGMISSTYGTNMNTQCINGQFSAYVELAALNQGDTTNRTGLLTANGTVGNYTLTLTITGYSSTDQPYQNQAYGIKTINLNP